MSTTPGPWKIYRRAQKHINGANISDGKINVCRMPYAADRSISQKEADARLIAAAPELLTELKHLVALMEPLEQNGELHIPGIATLNGAREAIAKAEGK